MTQPIPNASVSPIDPRTGNFTGDWYRYFKYGLASTTGATELPEYKLTGNASVRVLGVLANGVASLSLVGDSVSPSKTAYYGTDENGAKGWHLIEDAIEANSGLVKSVDANNVTTIGIDTTGAIDGDVLTYDSVNGWHAEAPPAGGSQDPFYFGVSSLLNFSGADGSTTFTDARNRVWTPSGNAQIDTSLGYNTGLFDGNDLISTPSHPCFDFGSGDWTIELWIYALSVTGFQNLARRSLTSAFAPFSIALDGNKLRTRCSESGGAWAVDVTSVATVSLSTLTHLEVCRDGNTFRQYIGGVQSGTGTFTSAGLMTSTSAVYIGAQSDAAGGYNGHIKGWRVTKGACRHPGGVTFTPDTAPFWTP